MQDAAPDRWSADPAPWPVRAGLALAAAVETLRHFLPAWWRPDVHEGDLAQHVWWTARFRDPGLFPDDPIADFFSLPLLAPPGYQGLYRLGVSWVEPQRWAESLPFLLAPLVVWLAWRAGRGAARGALAGGVTGALLSLLFLSGLAGGLPRAFAPPVLLLGLVALLERRAAWLGTALLAGALFYPPMVLTLGLAAGGVLAVRLARERRLPAGWPALAVLGGLAALLVLRSYATPLPEDVGPKVTRAEAMAMPEFGPEGRCAFWADEPLDTWLGRGRGGLGLGPREAPVFLAAVAASAWALRGVVPLVAWALLGTSLAAFGLAHALLFALHLPSRYTIYALPGFTLLWLASLAGHGERGLRARAGARRVRAALGAAVWAVALGVAARGAIEIPHELDEPLNTRKEATLAFLATLPRDALIAAHPEDADAIPLRTRRSVLASKETALPYYAGYYRRIAPRIEASLRALYAERWEDVAALRERWGVDVMVVNRRHLKPDRRHFEEPFESRLARRLRPGHRRRYVLHEPPEDRVLFRNERWAVVRLGPPRPGYGAPRAEEAGGAAQAASTNAPAAAGTR